MKRYVGGEFILTARADGLTIKRNNGSHGCGEFFDWNDIRHLFDAPEKAAPNSEYKQCEHDYQRSNCVWECVKCRHQL